MSKDSLGSNVQVFLNFVYAIVIFFYTKQKREISRDQNITSLKLTFFTNGKLLIETSAA